MRPRRLCWITPGDSMVAKTWVIPPSTRPLPRMASSLSSLSTPFWMDSTPVSGPSTGARARAAVSVSKDFTQKSTRSAGASPSRRSTAGACTTHSPSGADFTRRPWRRIASRCAPRATKVTSSPTRASFAPKKPPVPPEPITTMRMALRRSFEMWCLPTFGEASPAVKAGAVKTGVCYARADMAEPFLEVAVDAARRAGALLLDRFGSLRQIRYKGSPSNLVTEMDRQAEALVIECLRSRFPDHAILAEEGGARPGSPTHRWIVDPLDGTTNYAHGMPFFAVSIALEIEGSVQLGVVFDPNRDECFTVVRGEGAFLNDQPLRVSDTPTLDESLLSTGYPYDIRRTRDNNLAEHAAFMVRCRSVREMGSAAINLALVAAGRLDGFWELVLGPWDVAAGCLMVEEAGGRVTTPAGGPVDLGRPAVVASNGKIHDEMLATLREVRAQAPRG